jgi:hypothetical protein
MNISDAIMSTDTDSIIASVNAIEACDLHGVENAILRHMIVVERESGTSRPTLKISKQ